MKTFSSEAEVTKAIDHVWLVLGKAIDNGDSLTVRLCHKRLRALESVQDCLISGDGA